jgi:hypothetical protein
VGNQVNNRSGLGYGELSAEIAPVTNVVSFHLTAGKKKGDWDKKQESQKK